MKFTLPKKVDPVYATIAVIIIFSAIYFSGSAERFIVWWKLKRPQTQTLLTDPIPVASMALKAYAGANPKPQQFETAQLDSVSTFIVSDTHLKVSLRFQRPELKDCYVEFSGDLISPDGNFEPEGLSASVRCLFYERISDLGAIQPTSVSYTDDESVKGLPTFMIDKSEDALNKLNAWTKLSTAEKIKWGRE